MNAFLLRRGGAATRVLLGIVLLAAIAAGVAFFVLRYTPTGGDAVDWAARRVVSLIEATIVPEVGFGRFEYESPRTLRFLDLTLTSPEGDRVVEAGTLSVMLTEIPRRGQPVRIERVRIEGGRLRLIETRDPETGETGFRGLVPFIEPGLDLEGDEERPTQDYEGEPRLSDALRIREVALDDFGLVYEPASDEPPMRITGVTTTLEVEEGVEEGGHVWHGFDLELSRGSAMVASIVGRVDLDRVVVELAPSEFFVDLTEGPAQELPPAVQSLLREYDARGQLRIEASGVAPVRDLPAANLRATVNLTDFNIGFGEYRLPIAAATLEAELKHGIASLTSGDVQMLDGEALVDGQVDINDEARPATARWSASGLQLREILRGGAPEGETPSLAGLVESSGSATMRAAEGVQSLRGDGTIDITQGRFAKVGLVEQILTVIDVTRSEAKTNSELRGEFTLRGPAVDFSTISLRTPVAMVRGEGVLHFDGRLDFAVNGGPLEKVQNLLGEVGSWIGAVSDQLVKYRVRGTVDDPKVSVAPLGAGARIDRSELPGGSSR